MPGPNNRKFTVAAVQLSAGSDVPANLVKIRRLLSGVHGVDLIALPEVFAIRGGDDIYRRAAEPLDGPVMTAVAELAKNKKAWVLAGSIMEKAGRRVFNTSVLVDRSGRIRATYRKMHLFEARLEDGTFIREADAYERGIRPVTADIDHWCAGLSICYDIRFPELFRRYADKKAELLFVPSNFTQRTGRDHWEILVRARAIENQCFVVAPNQCGRNPVTGVRSYGNSMVVGPWGEILCRAGDKETVLVAELDRELLKQTRHRVPALTHRVLRDA